MIECPYCSVPVSSLFNHIKETHSPDIYLEFIKKLEKFIKEFKENCKTGEKCLDIHSLAFSSNYDEETIFKGLCHFYPDYFEDYFVFSTPYIYWQNRCFICGDEKENRNLIRNASKNSVIVTDIIPVCKHCLDGIFLWTKIKFKHSISYAHRLFFETNSPCNTLHGHTIEVQLEIEIPVTEHSFIDLRNIEKKFKNILDTKYDHVTMNNVIPNPMLEWMALFLFKEYDTMYNIKGIENIILNDGTYEVTMTNAQYRESKFRQSLYKKFKTDISRIWAANPHYLQK